MTNTAFDCLDPEMESEAQAIANYEDELKELAEEVNAQDEDFDEHKEEIIEGQKKVDEMVAQEVEQIEKWCNDWEPLKRYSIEYFKLYELDTDNDWTLEPVRSFRYGWISKDFWIKITYFSDDSWSLFIDIDKDDWFQYSIRNHWFKDYQEAIDSLNSIAWFIYDLVKWNI